MNRRNTLALAFAAAAVAGTTVLWWGRSQSGPAAVTSAPVSTTQKPATRLLLVTIDTLRADRLGVYSYAAARTPATDGVARAGVRFTRAYAPAPITLPSHGSLLTGLNPPRHGSRHNGQRLNDGVPTLATVLANRGFATAAFVSAFPLDRRFGLSRGFSVYDDEMPRDASGKQSSERPGAVTVDRAAAWLRDHRGGPFFLWVHLFEPHAPYGGQTAASRQRPLRDRYDDEVAEADTQVGRLLDALGAARQETLVVIAADHGEAFGEHGEITHSLFVYDTTLRVPWVMAGPGLPGDGRTIEAPVSLIDLAPTVLRLMAQPGFSVDGLDLGPLLLGAETLPERGLYAESMAPLLDFGWSPLRTVREEQWKYISAPTPELFDLKQDDAEMRNVAAERPDDVRRLEARLAQVERGASVRPGASVPDAEAARRLATLGYVTPARASTVTNRPDPKDRRQVAARLAEIASGELPEAQLVPALESVLREDPQNPQAHLRLGVALADRGDCAAAEPHLREAIAAGVPSADPFLSLALCLRAQSDVRGAARILTEARRVEPGNPVVEANLGLLAFEEGRIEECIRSLNAALAIDADLHQARFVLARALAKSGQRSAARREAETLLARLPPSAPQRPEVERLVNALR